MDDLAVLVAELEEMVAELHKRGHNTARIAWDIELMAKDKHYLGLQDVKRHLEHVLEPEI